MMILLLNAALGYDAQLPAREPDQAKQLLAVCPGLRFIVDGTEPELSIEL